MASIKSENKMASGNDQVHTGQLSYSRAVKENLNVLDCPPATADRGGENPGRVSTVLNDCTPRREVQQRIAERKSENQSVKNPGMKKLTTENNNKRLYTKPNQQTEIDDNSGANKRLYRKECTLNIEIEGNETIDIKTLLETVIGICGKGSVIACVPIVKNHYEMIMSDERFCSKLKPAFRVDETRVFARSAYENAIIVSMMHLSPMIPDYELENRLTSYGCRVVSPIWRRYYHFMDCKIEDGTRFMKVVMPHNISSLPYAMKFSCQGKAKHYRVIHTGQENVCNLCCSPDHQARYCPNTECYKCYELGHISFDCPLKTCRDCKHLKVNCRCDSEKNEQQPENKDQKIPEPHNETHRSFMKQQIAENIKAEKEYPTKSQMPQTEETMTESDNITETDMETDEKIRKRKMDERDDNDKAAKDEQSPEIECKAVKMSPETKGDNSEEQGTKGDNDKEPEGPEQYEETAIEETDDTLDLETTEKPTTNKEPYFRRKSIKVEPNYLKAEQSRTEKIANASNSKGEKNKQKKKKH